MLVTSKDQHWQKSASIKDFVVHTRVGQKIIAVLN